MKLLVQFELRKIRAFFATRTLAKTITSLLFVAVFAFVGSGVYFFFVSGFRYINVEAVEDIRLALTLFIYEVFLLLLAGIIIFSAMVSGLFNLFKGDSNAWIISSPSYKFFPKIVLIRSMASSLLPSLVVFLPAMLAFNKVNGLTSVSLFLVVISVVLLLVTLNAVTLSIIVLIGHLYYKASQVFTRIRFLFRDLIVLLLLIAFSIIVVAWKTTAGINLVHLFRADVDSVSLSVSNIGNHFVYFPTHPFAMEILSLQSSEQASALLYFSLMMLFALLSVIVWNTISSLYYPIWLRFQEGEQKTTSKIGLLIQNTATYHFIGSNSMALFTKEVLVFSRNFKGLLWFLFLMLIWILQIGANVVIGNNIDRYQPDLHQKTVILQALQFVIAIYFISAFTLRFAFPSFSIEKKIAWIVGTAPISAKKVFLGKYAFFSIFFIVIGIVMNILNTFVLGLSFTHTLYSMILLVSTVLCVVTFGLVLGKLFPSTETDDPETISTSMTGLFFTAISLLFGGLSALVLYLTLVRGTLFMLFGFVVLANIVTIFLLVTVFNSMNHLKNLE